MIDELPVEKDLVGIPVQHDMLGVVDIKAIDTLLVAAVMDGRDGFWKFCRLQDMSVVYSFFVKATAPMNMLVRRGCITNNLFRETVTANA